MVEFLCIHSVTGKTYRRLIPKSQIITIFEDPDTREITLVKKRQGSRIFMSRLVFITLAEDFDALKEKLQ